MIPLYLWLRLSPSARDALDSSIQIDLTQAMPGEASRLPEAQPQTFVEKAEDWADAR